MPISKKEFKKVRKIHPSEKAVLLFLRRNLDTAYTDNEVAQGIGYVLGNDLLTD